MPYLKDLLKHNLSEHDILSIFHAIGNNGDIIIIVAHGYHEQKYYSVTIADINSGNDAISYKSDRIEQAVALATADYAIGKNLGVATNNNPDNKFIIDTIKAISKFGDSVMIKADGEREQRLYTIKIWSREKVFGYDTDDFYQEYRNIFKKYTDSL